MNDANKNIKEGNIREDTIKEKTNNITNTNNISKDMVIAEIITNHPYLAEYIMDYGVHCVGCGIATLETLEEGFMAHGISEEEIDQIIIELNKIIVETQKNYETTQ